MFTRISSRELRRIPVYFKNRTVMCEYPDSFKDRENGLKDREILMEHHGMLFNTYSRYQPLFTMRDVRIDLEAVFIGNDYTIKDVVPMRKMDGSTAYTTPLRIPIKYVVELNKGYTRRYGIELGDKIRIS